MRAEVYESAIYWTVKTLHEWKIYIFARIVRDERIKCLIMALLEIWKAVLYQVVWFGQYI